MKLYGPITGNLSVCNETCCFIYKTDLDKFIGDVGDKKELLLDIINQIKEYVTKCDILYTGPVFTLRLDFSVKTFIKNTDVTISVKIREGNIFYSLKTKSMLPYKKQGCILDLDNTYKDTLLKALTRVEGELNNT